MCSSVNTHCVNSSGNSSPGLVPGCIGTCFISDHFYSQLTLSSYSTPSSLSCLTVADSSLDWKEFGFGTTPLEIQMESPFSGLRTSPCSRRTILLLYILESFFLNIKKIFTKYEDAPSFDHHFLSELLCVKVYFRALMVNQLLEKVFLCWLLRVKYTKLHLIESASNEAVIEIFFHF